MLRVSESEAIPSEYEEGDEANTVVSFDKSRKKDSSRGRISQLDNKHTSNKGYFEHMAVRVDENRSKSLIKRREKKKWWILLFEGSESEKYDKKDKKRVIRV